MYHHIAKKSLGQNFLNNQAIIDKIIAAANPTATETVLEIGPGKGILTKSLVACAGTTVAIEKDNGLFAHLGELFEQEINQGKLSLVHGDALDFDPETLRSYGSYKLVANIPYNITGAIIEKFLSCSFQPTMMVLMVQKEVAERIVAKNKKTGGQGKESILSIAVKVYGEPEYICTVKAGNFTPAPKIDSAVIKINNISREKFLNKHHEEVFFQIMKAGFAHKRKTLAGNLKNILEPELVTAILSSNNISPSVRAEDLGINDWLILAQLVYNNQYVTE
jgi:16S rRNA (adenine1518-N6/adenine1519-N6)-dimethyltransferase